MFCFHSSPFSYNFPHFSLFELPSLPFTPSLFHSASPLSPTPILRRGRGSWGSGWDLLSLLPLHLANKVYLPDIYRIPFSPLSYQHREPKLPRRMRTGTSKSLTLFITRGWGGGGGSRGRAEGRISHAVYPRYEHYGGVALNHH